MSTVLAAAAALVANDVAAARRSPRPGLTGAAAAAAVLQPVAAFVVGAGAAVAWAALRWRTARRRDEMLEGEVVLLAELTALGVAAGLSFVAALERAAADVHPMLRREVAGVLGRARLDGQAVALAAAEGRAAPLYRLAGRALATGAPLARSLDAYAASQRDEARARRLAAARRLPVRLLVPLALLILPGFVLLTAGPAVLAGLERIAG